MRTYIKSCRWSIAATTKRSLDPLRWLQPEFLLRHTKGTNSMNATDDRSVEVNELYLHNIYIYTSRIPQRPFPYPSAGPVDSPVDDPYPYPMPKPKQPPNSL